MQQLAYEAGTNQVIVVFVSEDTGLALDPGPIFAAIAADAAAREPFGWRIGSITSVPLRQMGTTGNILFQSGGQFATRVAVAVVYARDAAGSAVPDGTATVPPG